MKLKEKIRNLSITTATIILLGVIMLLYLYITGHLEGFINYTILGLGEFASENILINISLLIVSLAIVSLNIYIAIKLIRKNWLSNEQNTKIKTFVIFSTFLTMSILPIINKAHFYVGMFLSFVLSTILFSFFAF